MAPARAAQPVAAFLMVMFIIIGMPVRPSVISFRTKLAGTLVGNGPSVSDGVTAQSLLELPFVEPVAVVLPPVVLVPAVIGSTVVCLQAPIIGTTAAMPSRLLNPRFKNSLRSIAI